MAEYVDKAVRHVLLRQGVLGLKVKILLDWDPSGKQGPKTPFPDRVSYCKQNAPVASCWEQDAYSTYCSNRCFMPSSFDDGDDCLLACRSSSPRQRTMRIWHRPSLIRLCFAGATSAFATVCTNDLRLTIYTYLFHALGLHERLQQCGVHITWPCPDAIRLIDR